MLTVYKYWISNRGNLRTLLGNLVFFILHSFKFVFCSLGGLNESKMIIPFEGDETACVPETNDVAEVKEGIIGVQEEEDDRTEAPQACEEEGIH